MADASQHSNTSQSHCRLCGSQKTTAELLDLSRNEKTYHEFIVILKYLKVDLDFCTASSLPKTSCYKCYKIFQESFKFFKNLEQSQSVLCDYYKKKNLGTIGKSTKDDKNFGHCRFCAVRRRTTDIIDLNEDKKIMNELLKIFHYFKFDYVDFTHAMLPNNSCQHCYNTLDDYYKFIKNVHKCQSILNTIYSGMGSDSDNVKDEHENVSNWCITLYEDTTLSRLDERESWSTYTWACRHCGVAYKNVDDLRSHSKDEHNMCVAFKCADCNEKFDKFDLFVEHVRTHREYLRLHCEFCNDHFLTVLECVSHVRIHDESTQSICQLCGELFPYPNTLLWHQKLYGQRVIMYKDERSRSWDDYSWSCQECKKKVCSASALRLHVQRSHGRCFAMKCMDCNKILKNFKVFVAHVCGHRPYLRKFCQYCNAHFEDAKLLNNHIVHHITSQRRPCNGCGQIFQNNTELADHKKTYIRPETQPKTRRGRKPVRLSLTTEALTCLLCDRLYDNLTCLKRHVKTHDLTRPRDFICPTCGRAFLTSNTMKEHAKTHNVKDVICQLCLKPFHTIHKLKAHLITHSVLRPFVCDECGNSFKTKKRLKCHLVSHSTVKPHKCAFCSKEFKFKENLKTHMHQHTGMRPYACEYCERTFTNWTNCNKHMIRKHGVTLARTKITARGRMSIDRRTGQVAEVPADVALELWAEQVLNPQSRTGDVIESTFKGGLE